MRKGFDLIKGSKKYTSYGVRTHAVVRPADLKSAALDHSAMILSNIILFYFFK